MEAGWGHKLSAATKRLSTKSDRTGYHKVVVAAHTRTFIKLFMTKKRN